jgi:hypothetical protein
MTPFILLVGPLYGIYTSSAIGRSDDGLTTHSEHSDLTRSSWFSYQLGRLAADNVDSTHASALYGCTSTGSYSYHPMD